MPLKKFGLNFFIYTRVNFSKGHPFLRLISPANWNLSICFRCKLVGWCFYAGKICLKWINIFLKTALMNWQMFYAQTKTCEVSVFKLFCNVRYKTSDAWHPIPYFMTSIPVSKYWCLQLQVVKIGEINFSERNF